MHVLIFQVETVYLPVLCALVHSLVLICNTGIFVHGSTVYRLDRRPNLLFSRTINQPIDHVVDDQLYVLSRRRLTKIDINTLETTDHLPLPYQFNHMLATRSHIAIIASNEIVLVERKNLSYAASIGLENGDYKPLIKNYRGLSLPENLIFLSRDQGNKSVLLSIDTQSGEIKRKTTVTRIMASYYSKADRLFYFYNADKQILIYDHDLKKKSARNTTITARVINPEPEGFIVADNGHFAILNHDGEILDFQPVPLSSRTSFNILGLVHEGRIVLIDASTMRPVNTSPDAGWLDIISINDPDYCLLLDTLKMFYLASIPELETRLLPFEKPFVSVTELPAAIEPLSWWYVQLGAFASRDNADAAQRLYRDRGLPAMIEETELFRVKIGGFPEKEDALHFIAAAGINGWLVFQPGIKNGEEIVFSLNSENYRFKDGIITKEQP